MDVVMGMPGAVPPLDPNVRDDADADLERRIAFLRTELAKPLSASRARMLSAALREAEGSRRKAA